MCECNTDMESLPKGLILEHARLDNLWQKLVREKQVFKMQLNKAREEYDPKHKSGCNCFACRRWHKTFTVKETIW